MKNTSKQKTVILAYSGGLDTTVCIAWLKERGYRVIGFCSDVGQDEDFTPVRKRGMSNGAAKIIIQDQKKEFVQDYVLPALKAGAVYQEKYLLATALSRPLIAKGLVDLAKKEGAVAIAHGCTAKGNDQVRIEASLKFLNPKLKLWAPVREWEMKSRQEEVAYGKKHGLKLPPAKDAKYSIDQNLWGVAIESGELEDPWTEPPEGCYRWTKDPIKAPNKPDYVEIGFKQGAPISLNGKNIPLITIIEKLNKLGSKHGVGRTDLIEDRLVGIKSREIYEAPAADILHRAHVSLEEFTLDRETLALKTQLSQKYAQLTYNGLWFTPLKESLDAFVNHTQKPVTGTVRVKLSKGQAIVVGRKAAKSRYSEELATYSGEDLFDHSAAGGFIDLWALPYTKR